LLLLQIWRLASTHPISILGTGRPAPADEARHLVKVLRLAPGAIVGVFDGRGHEWQARVETAGREGVEVLLLEPVPAQRPAVEITLVQAVLKGEPMDSVVRDCTMVGIAALQPVLTARTTVKTSVTLAAPERWRRIASHQPSNAALPDYPPSARS
jgi:16S rRNA (uracil1498-N3)-methyltransferase